MTCKANAESVPKAEATVYKVEYLHLEPDNVIKVLLGHDLQGVQFI
jgi:hypothetical protein